MVCVEGVGAVASGPQPGELVSPTRAGPHAVEDLLGDPPTQIEIDASGLTFADSAGLRAFLVSRKDAEAAGVELRVTQVSEPLDRVLEMTGLRDVLGAPAA